MSDKQTYDEKHNQPQRYEIRIKGHLDDRWADWFEGPRHHAGREWQHAPERPGDWSKSSRRTAMSSKGIKKAMS